MLAFDALGEAAAIASCLEKGVLTMHDITLEQWQFYLAFCDGREDRRALDAASPKGAKQGGLSGSSYTEQEMIGRVR